jgi:hypothetical protein
MQCDGEKIDQIVSTTGSLKKVVPNETFVVSIKKVLHNFPLSSFVVFLGVSYELVINGLYKVMSQQKITP